jgi:UTP-glucose-1-phosphate uridylyltransferase
MEINLKRVRKAKSGRRPRNAIFTGDKACPKKCTIVDKPTIQYIVEAIESGIEDIIIVTVKGRAIASL